jgi:thiol-disulfide isomerase/thioredoxin/uncharacterized RDD family membrane protein YckC
LGTLLEERLMSDERRSREEILADLERFNQLANKRRNSHLDSSLEAESSRSHLSQPDVYRPSIGRKPRQEAGAYDLPAGFWRRAVAFTLDVAISQLFVGLIVVIAVGQILWLSAFVAFTLFQSPVWLVVLGVGAVAAYILYIFACDRLFGGTPGRLLMGVRPLDSEYLAPLSFWQWFWRETIGKFASALTLGIGYIMAGFREDKRALHDLIAGTQVRATIAQLHPVRWVIGIACILAIQVFDWRGDREASKPLAQVDAQAVASIDLQPLSSAELGMMIGGSSAKGIVVNFWGPNCGPCRQEFPHFLKLRKKYQDQGLEMIFVGVDDESDKEAMATFLAQNRVDFASYYRGERVDTFLRGVDKSWSGVIPFTMVYDSNRNIIHARPGFLSKAKLEGLIQNALSLD